MHFYHLCVVNNTVMCGSKAKDGLPHKHTEISQRNSKTTERKAWNKWRNNSLPLRQQYLVMSPGASREGVRSGGAGWNGAIGPSPFFILMTGLRVERVKKEKQGKEERWTGGAWRGLGPGFPAWWMEHVCREEKKHSIVVLQTNKKRGRLNKWFITREKVLVWLKDP